VVLSACNTIYGGILFGNNFENLSGQRPEHKGTDLNIYKNVRWIAILLLILSGCAHINQPPPSEKEEYGLELNPSPAGVEPAATDSGPIDAAGESETPLVSETTSAGNESPLDATQEAASTPSPAVEPELETIAKPDGPALTPDGDGIQAREKSRAAEKTQLAYAAENTLQEKETPEGEEQTDTVPAAEPEKLEPPSGQFIENKIKPEKSVQTIMDEALGFCQAAQEFWQKGELLNALEALDQAYSLILEIEIDDMEIEDQPDVVQQKDDIRFLISKRILEIYASRNIVVQGNHNAIPMSMNKYVRAELRRFTVGNERNFFKQSLVRSGRYRPYIVAKLKEAGLPEELSWLPLIESGYKVKALSKARALGLWQFIPSTGYKFGLKRDQYIDERIDPVKSTDAAIAYLKELHNIFGDWATVLAAYNCGEGRVLRVIRTQNINYLDNFWDLYERLPRETARYVPRFLATLHIMNDKAQYGLENVTLDQPLNYETIEVNRQVQVTDIARKIGVSGKELKHLNPELRYNILPPDTYQLKVPPGTSEILLSTINDIPISHPPRPAYVYHRVRSGETLSGIAVRYRTSVRRIMRANNLRTSRIYAGKKLKIPQKGTIITHAKQPVTDASGKYFVHVVRSGDSLWNIAKRYGTTTKKIQEFNNIRGTTLHAGQRLKIPGYLNGSTSDTDLSTYLVRRGDSPYTIARRHNMSLGELLRLNGLTPRSKIYPGQELRVK
jgi:membrane-bound lytic murein transglycosylase D